MAGPPRSTIVPSSACCASVNPAAKADSPRQTLETPTEIGFPSSACIRRRRSSKASALAEYDEQRGAQLVTTLEEFLRRHGNISATSEALFVHPNTLRQRLRRIAELSGLDLRRDEWLMIEIAVKMVKLKQTLGTVPRSSA